MMAAQAAILHQLPAQTAMEPILVQMNDSNTEQNAVARYEALLNAAVDAIILIGTDGSIETCNAAAEKMFGYTADEVLGENVRTLMPEPYRAEHDSYMKHYLDTGERRIIGIGREVLAQRRNGDVFPVHLSVGEVLHGSERCFVGIISDISKRKETEQKLRQQQERLEHVTRLGTLGEMAAGIAHEINQPLTAIATYAQAAIRMLDKGMMETDRLQSVLTKMSVQADRAGQIIHRVRQLARHQTADQELVSVNGVIRDTLKLAEVDARYHQVVVDPKMQADLPRVWLNPVQIQQVVLNLMRNAIEASPAATHIGLRTASVSGGEEIEIEVTDNGPGVPPELRSEIFNPFFTTREHGTGMGLSISRSIVLSHGGQIEVGDSTSGGARFTVTLPTAIRETDGNHET